MKKIKAFIVDDEFLLIKTLQSILTEFCSEIEIVGTSTDPFDAKVKIDMLKPDVVFLDINMPKVNGLEMLDSFNSRKFEVIFITAYSQYAPDALKKGAIDYILKPILSEDVINSVKRLKELMKLKVSDKKETTSTDDAMATQKIIVKNNNTFLFLEHKDILWFEADHNYTKIHLTTGKIISSAKPIKYYDSLVPNNLFFRIHKSYIINTLYIKKYLRDDKGPLVVLSSDVRLRIAQPKQPAFRKFMISNESKSNI